jgi:hypothetical protein
MKVTYESKRVYQKEIMKVTRGRGLKREIIVRGNLLLDSRFLNTNN